MGDVFGGFPSANFVDRVSDRNPGLQSQRVRVHDPACGVFVVGTQRPEATRECRIHGHKDVVPFRRLKLIQKVGRIIRLHAFQQVGRFPNQVGINQLLEHAGGQRQFHVGKDFGGVVHPKFSHHFNRRIRTVFEHISNIWGTLFGNGLRQRLWLRVLPRDGFQALGLHLLVDHTRQRRPLLGWIVDFSHAGHMISGVRVAIRSN